LNYYFYILFEYFNFSEIFVLIDLNNCMHFFIFTQLKAAFVNVVILKTEKPSKTSASARD